MADCVEAELGLRDIVLPPGALGAIDTFRFEERTLLAQCGDLVAAKNFDQALDIISGREHSFWLDRDVVRKAQWEACRRMAELGTLGVAVRAAVSKAAGDADAWIDAYASKDGWFRLDQAQRRLEAWVANLDDEPEERPLGVVRGVYGDAGRVMAEGFTKALVAAKWTVSPSLHQTRIFSEVVSEQPKPVAYFFVDAMRFEMGVELAERLPKSVEVSVRPAVCALPSITPTGMAALQPGASSSFSVVEQAGMLGAKIDDAFLPDLTARKKFAACRGARTRRTVCIGGQDPRRRDRAGTDVPIGRRRDFPQDTDAGGMVFGRERGKPAAGGERRSRSSMRRDRRLSTIVRRRRSGRCSTVRSSRDSTSPEGRCSSSYAKSRRTIGTPWWLVTVDARSLGAHRYRYV